MMFTNCFRFRKSRGCAGSGAQKRRNAARASQHHLLMAEIACSYDDAVLPVNAPWLQIVADVPWPSTPPGLCLATPPNPALSRSLKNARACECAGKLALPRRSSVPESGVCAQNRAHLFEKLCSLFVYMPSGKLQCKLCANIFTTCKP
jgi:hypothetical protein